MIVDGDDYQDPDHIPVFFRLTLTHGAALSQTLVDPLVGDSPIHLTPTLFGPQSGIALAVQAHDLQIVRAIAGENRLWLRINRPTSTWLDTDGDGIGDAPPTPENPVAFTIGVEAGAGNEQDTRLSVDLQNQGCGALPVGRYLKFERLELVPIARLSAPGFPHNAPYEYYSEKNCAYVSSIDMNLMIAPFIRYTIDYRLGLGVDEPQIGIEIIGPDTIPVGTPLTLIGNLNGHVSNALVRWNFGDEDKRAAGVNNLIEHTYTSPGAYLVQATASNDQGHSGTAEKTIIVTPTHRGVRAAPGQTRTRQTTTMSKD